MTPKEKAKELVDKFSKHADTYHNGNFENSKKCALIAVDEIISDLFDSFSVCDGLHPHARGLIGGMIINWKEIKQEIEKL